MMKVFFINTYFLPIEGFSILVILIVKIVLSLYVFGKNKEPQILNFSSLRSSSASPIRVGQ